MQRHFLNEGAGVDIRGKYKLKPTHPPLLTPYKKVKGELGGLQPRRRRVDSRENVPNTIKLMMRTVFLHVGHVRSMQNCDVN